MLSVLSLPLLALSFALPQASAHYRPVAAAWYTGWHALEGLPLSHVSWDKYNTLIYAVAATTPSVHNLSLDASEPTVLPQFVDEAHKHGVAAHVALGGWTASRWFSSNVATPKNRTAFVKTVVDFAQQYKIDGLDFDWEYPNAIGIGCNTISPNDTKNFLSFLQELRKNPVGATLTLSAATHVLPFVDATGGRSTDVTGFAK
ncbi:glycoside hydrolase family 18 protein, partial [Paxillus rubicundulus Ve08.2h10]